MPLFGMRAGEPALLANKSYFEKKVINWDPEKAVVVWGFEVLESGGWSQLQASDFSLSKLFNCQYPRILKVMFLP